VSPGSPPITKNRSENETRATDGTEPIDGRWTIPTVNRQVCEKLREAADLLEQQGANRFRVEAYRRAAETVGELKADVAMLTATGGREALTELPNIGRAIAGAILEIVDSGRWGLLERLRGSFDPVALFQRLPGIGPELAERIHETLHVDTLEALEVAAHDGRLEEVDGIGTNRAAAIRAALASSLQRVRGRRPLLPNEAPDVATLLEVDGEYRRKAAAGVLRTIAPRRHNPDGESWLPLLHTERDRWHFTAMFSNSARAHTLDRTRDWVVIYFEDDEGAEGQVTVVTERRGPLESKRVVRGRESECLGLYSGRQS
jgi:putative hydrolase